MTRFKGTYKEAAYLFEDLRVAKYRFTLQAGEKGLELPPFSSSSFRGAFGHVFKELTCAYKGRPCSGCPIQQQCPYTYIFETKPPQESKIFKNFENVPRPYVFITEFDQKTDFRPGEQIEFKLLLIGGAIPYLPYFVHSFEILGRIGIGKRKKEFKLVHVEQVDMKEQVSYQIYNGDTKMLKSVNLFLTGEDLIQRANKINVNRVTIHFETPLRMRYKGRFTDNPQFHLLIRNAVRRISSCLYFHHGKELKMDYTRLFAMAEGVHLEKNESHWVDWERYSARQEMKMQLGGIIGQATYEGELNGFIPWLVAGQVLHIGKQTAFGLGKYRCLWG